MPSSTPRHSVATPLLRALSRELARAGGLLAPDYLESGLSLGEARCVYELGHADGLAISELAARLELDLGYVSRAVSRLCAAGLASKRAGHADRRSRRVVLTARGKKQLAALDRHANQRFDAWVAQKPAPQVAALVSGLRALYAPAPAAAPAAAEAAPVELRAPRPGAIGHIIARHGEIYAELGYPASFERYVVEAFADFVRDLAPPRDQIFVAERAGRLVGSIAVKGLPDATAQLRFLVVEPEARGLGLGRRLVERVLAHARAQGERRIVLDTASDLAAARALYTSYGFVKTRSTAKEPWLPRGVKSERWELELG